MKNEYDIAIVGSGPIGAATAYFLSQQKKKKEVVVITQDPTDDHSSAYLYAGGSVQYSYWPNDSLKAEMTKMTADFIKKKVKDGKDFSVIDNHYLFLDEGVFAPALNIAGAKLVNFLLKKAVDQGVVLQGETVLKKISKENGIYHLDTNKGQFLAPKVLLAVGANIHKFIPKMPVEFEKRVLLVFNIPVEKEERVNWPHVVIPMSEGWVYIFIKKIGDQYKMLLGQEDVIKHNKKWEPENYLDKLIKKGLLKTVPFLKKAKVEKMLWGFDSKKSTPDIVTSDNQLFAVNCGSAVRSCAYIGQIMAKKLLT